MLTQWNNPALYGVRQEMDRLFQRLESGWPEDPPIWKPDKEGGTHHA